MTKTRFKTKQYKERVQPAARRKLGMLEKHKDYVERARHTHEKKRQMKELRRKAQNANPDEFRFQMENARLDTQTGKRRLLPGKVEREEELKNGKSARRLLQTQDIAYLEMRRSVDMKKVEKLRAQLHGIDHPIQGRHTLFVDDDVAERVQRADDDAGRAAVVAEALDTLPELLETRTRPTLASLRSDASVVVGGSSTGALTAAAEKNRRLRYKEMRARTKRAQKLGDLARQLELKRELSKTQHGRARKFVTPSGRAAVVWCHERLK